jgi:hypothetical protein
LAGEPAGNGDDVDEIETGPARLRTGRRAFAHQVCQDEIAAKWYALGP